MILDFDFTVLRVLAILLIWPLGYLTHELMHVLPLAAAGATYEVEFNPGDRPMWWNLTVGRAFEFRMQTGALLGIIAYMFPLVLWWPAVLEWGRMLWIASNGGQISVTSALFVASWFMIFLPSLSDWVNAYAAAKVWRGAE